MQESRLKFTQQIFVLICERTGVTRGELALAAPRSLMSVGKAADTLIAAGLVSESRLPASGPGRRAGHLTARPASFAVIDITTRHFCVELFDLRQKISARLLHAYNENIFFLENLYIFADRVDRFLEAKRDTACVGAGILLPGRYRPERDQVFCARTGDFDTIHPRSVFAGKLGGLPLLIDEDLQMGALFAAESVAAGADIILYMKIDIPVGAALIIAGTPYRGIHAGALSRLGSPGNALPDGRLFTACASFLERLKGVAELLNNFLTLFTPDAIIIESAEFVADAGVAETLTSLLQTDFHLPAELLPPISFLTGNGSYAKRGIVGAMRNRWLADRLNAHTGSQADGTPSPGQRRSLS